MNTTDLDKVSELTNIIEANIDEENDKEDEQPAKRKELVVDGIDPDEFENYLMDLNKLTVIELYDLKNKTQFDIENLKAAKSVLDEITKIKDIDSSAKNIMEANALESNDIVKNVDSFKQEYEVNVNTCNRIIERVTELIDEYGDTVNSTKFLTNQMLTYISKKISAMNTEDLNYNYYMKRYDNVKDAFLNRTSLQYLTKKAQGFMSNKSNIKAYKKFSNNAEYKNGLYKPLLRVFNKELIDNMEKTIKPVMDDDIAYILFIIFITRILSKEFKTGNDTWIKVLLLNIGDNCNGYYDLDGNNETFEEYMISLDTHVLSQFKNHK